MDRSTLQTQISDISKWLWSDKSVCITNIFKQQRFVYRIYANWKKKRKNVDIIDKDEIFVTYFVILLFVWTIIAGTLKSIRDMNPFLFLFAIDKA